MTNLNIYLQLDSIFLLIVIIFPELEKNTSDTSCINI